MSNLKTIPFYVTRKSANGVIGTWGITPWPALIIVVLMQLALFLWLLIAIVTAISIIVNAVSGVF